MGPFFALGDALGLPAWLVQRLWLGPLLALAAWGVGAAARRAARPPARRRARRSPGLLFLLNPYVVVFAARTSVTLLAYAALPWLLLCRAPRAARAARLAVAGGVRARAGADRAAGSTRR